jgi:CrcB protein
MNVLLVILGAAIGAPARFAIDQYIRKFTTKPYGIFTVNILGSFFLGLTYGKSEHVHDLFAIGFAGAFTTWSTFMLDIYLAFEGERSGLIYILMTAVLSLIAVVAIIPFAQKVIPVRK